MPSRDILLEANRPGSFGLSGAALRTAESNGIRSYILQANDAVVIPKQPWPFSAA